VIDHLTAMCQPHGFVVTDHDCFQPIVALVWFPCLSFVGNQTWSVRCALLVYSRPLTLRILQPKVSEFSSGKFVLISPLSPPLCLCPYAAPPLLFIVLYLLGVFLSGFLTRLYTDPSIGELFSIAGTPRQYILFNLICVLTAYLSFPLSSSRV
jgi:hypothetical protein